MPDMPRYARPTLRVAIFFALAACASAGPTATPPTDPSLTPPAPTWTLAWSDDFNGPAGAPVDAAKWVTETGGQGWGNNELQYYTATGNASLDGAGHLVITARAEPSTTTRQCWYGTCRYTSARLKTKGLFESTYGRFESRIRIPRGQGLWPAFWMLGTDVDTAGWPTCGEIDIMENIGREPNMVHGTLHGPRYSGGNGIGGPFVLASGSFADDFHVFAVEWTPNQVRWLVDEREYHKVTPTNLPGGARWVFDHQFFLLLNVAVGGGWPGNPDASTTFPQQMVVDYVRAYRQ